MREYVNCAPTGHVKAGEIYRAVFSRISFLDWLNATSAAAFGATYDAIPSAGLGATVSARPDAAGRATTAVIDVKVPVAVGSLSVASYGDGLHNVSGLTFLERLELLPQGALVESRAVVERQQAAGTVQQRLAEQGVAGVLRSLSGSAKLLVGVVAIGGAVFVLWQVLPLLQRRK